MVHASRGRLRPAVAAPAQRGGDRVPGWPRRCSAREPRGATGRRSPPTTTGSATASSSAWSPASTTSTRGCAARRLRAAARARATRGRFPTATGKAHFTVNALTVLRVPAGPAAAADASQPRPVQHHDLRPRRPLPRRSSSGRRVVFVNPARPRRSSASPTARLVDLVREWHDGVERRAPRLPRRRATRPRAAARPRTSPRPTCWCRSTRTAETSNTPTSKSIVVRLEPTRTEY